MKYVIVLLSACNLANIGKKNEMILTFAPPVQTAVGMTLDVTCDIKDDEVKFTQPTCVSVAAGQSEVSFPVAYEGKNPGKTQCSFLLTVFDRCDSPRLPLLTAASTQTQVFDGDLDLRFTNFTPIDNDNDGVSDWQRHVAGMASPGGPTNMNPMCVPETCASRLPECGSSFTTCDMIVTCTAAQGCTCTLQTQAEACFGKECGVTTNLCQQQVACGSCTGFDQCMDNQCVCVPNQFACNGAQCGTRDDGCGTPVDCPGTCAENTYCDAVSPNQCGVDQTYSYFATPPDDTAARFSVTGNVVCDTVTKLKWTIIPSHSSGWSNFTLSCPGARLPTLADALSLGEFGPTGGIDPSWPVIYNAPSGGVFTQTNVPSDGTRKWVVKFGPVGASGALATALPGSPVTVHLDDNGDLTWACVDGPFATTGCTNQ